jgi:hypothetical protein
MSVDSEGHWVTEMTALLSTLQLTEPFLHSIIKDDVEGFDV